MNRREFIASLAGALAWPLVARAQQATKSYQIGYLALLPGEDAVLVKPLLQRLQELGYAVGTNLMFEYRSAEGRAERLPQLAAEFVSLKPDVLIAGFGTLTAQASKAATSTIPVVFTSVGDPLGAGVVASLSRPSGNVTGQSSQASEIGGKRLQILNELVPGRKMVAALLNPNAPFSVLALQELRAAAAPRLQRLEVFEATTADQVATGIEAAANGCSSNIVGV